MTKTISIKFKFYKICIEITKLMIFLKDNKVVGMKDNMMEIGDYCFRVGQARIGLH